MSDNVKIQLYCNDFEYSNGIITLHANIKEIMNEIGEDELLERMDIENVIKHYGESKLEEYFNIKEILE